MADGVPAWDEVPLVTADLPGTGGTARLTPDDFEVEELPAYLPAGAGDHLFLWVEKRGRNTRDVVRELARALGAPENEAGVAGQKDRNALTRQFISLPRVEASRAEGLSGEGWRVLKAARHGNKLRTGHLRGNRFRISIRGGTPDALQRAQAIAAELARRGLPNAYGPQRFGRGGANGAVGRALVKGERTPDTARAIRDRFLRRMMVSAFQAELFNRVLARRLREGSFAKALAGDLMKKLETGGLFVSEQPEVDQPRVDGFEISPTGPMFGHRMMEPKAEALALEQSVLAAEGIALSDFARLKADGEGSRRPIRLPISIGVSEENGALWLDFSLPAGSYATCVLREVMKPQASDALPEEREG